VTNFHRPPPRKPSLGNNTGILLDCKLIWGDSQWKWCLFCNASCEQLKCIWVD